MLKEFKKVSQPQEASGRRRWFSDEDMDLIAWYSPEGAVRGFQLCYDREGRERAFTWQADSGMTHAAVDAGEDSPLRNDTPILVPDASPPVARVLEKFKANAGEVDPNVAAIVVEKLAAFLKPR